MTVVLNTWRSQAVRACFAGTIFTSAFLLFQVQPLISKYILPWFGGSPAVWSTCMLFFQVVLFAGYVYAHVLTAHCRPRTQAIVHTSLLLAAACLLPISPSDVWKPTAAEAPVLRIVLLLGASVGLPYFLLSSTGPLLQSWFSSTQPGSSPYRLYALSNVASLLALISYPFVFEPALSSPAQAGLWSVGFVVFAVLCAACAFTRTRAPFGNALVENSPPGRGVGGEEPLDARSEQQTAPHPQPLSPEYRGEGRNNYQFPTHSESHEQCVPTWGDRCMWFTLAMVASVMLLATTNQVCMDVATVPFLWIIPLTIYLLSFILCFDADRWYSRKWYFLLLAVALLGTVKMLMSGSSSSILTQVLVYLSALYLCCMVCHGELAQQKPQPRYLTSFYLLISAGGAGGGLFVGLLAPSVFPAYWELHVGIAACLVSTLAVLFRDRGCWLYRGQPRPAWAALCVWAGLLVYSLQVNARDNVRTALDVSRNFYGVLRVEDDIDAEPHQARRGLFHGRILHGFQFLAPEKHLLPTTYYGPKSGAGLALNQHRVDSARRIGVVGLGVGTVAVYGNKKDHMRFYEINDDVIRVAQQHFTFLKESPATCEMVLGDARLSLEQEAPQRFDVLILDAFSGDAIPTHLLTREAGDLYAKHVRDDGLLCIHLSNLHFDLRPVVAGLAQYLKCEVAFVHGHENAEQGTTSTHWAILSRQPISAAVLAAADEVQTPKSSSLLWTDEWSNLLSVLR